MRAVHTGAWLVGLLLVAIARADVHPLQVRVELQQFGHPLAPGGSSGTNTAGQEFSVSRLDLLLSGFALRNEAGEWLEFPEAFAFVSAADAPAAGFRVEVPAGRYDRMRVRVGVPPDRNHADVGSFAADHPLNPNVNGLHWSWLGGFVFLAFEGHWRDTPTNRWSGFSLHLATDAQLATVERPLRIDVPAVPGLTLTLQAEKLFDGPGAIRLQEDAAATHSREGDDLANRLRRNVEGAIEAAIIDAEPRGTVTAQPPVAPALVAGTPYRLTFPRAFPIPALPRDNPLTDEGVALGERLFHEPRLSINNSQSCSSCHQEPAAFSDAGKTVSTGAEGRAGSRNAMALVNLAWKRRYFWDGRAGSLREQVLMPIADPAEMHETPTNVAAKLAATPEFPPLFRAAFGAPDITPARIALALEQFLLTRTSFQSRFDRALRGEVELNADEKRGFELFSTEYDPRRGLLGADCFHCHGGALFSNQGFANNGLDAEFRDPGRFLVTSNRADLGAFAVPTLRNVALTAPYMHDGRFATLEEVVDHYSEAVARSDTLDPNLAKHPDVGLRLPTADRQALVAFLKTLTDSRPPR